MGRLYDFINFMFTRRCNNIYICLFKKATVLFVTQIISRTEIGSYFSIQTIEIYVTEFTTNDDDHLMTMMKLHVSENILNFMIQFLMTFLSHFLCLM